MAPHHEPSALTSATRNAVPISTPRGRGEDAQTAGRPRRARRFESVRIVVSRYSISAAFSVCQQLPRPQLGREPSPPAARGRADGSVSCDWAMLMCVLSDAAPRIAGHRGTPGSHELRTPLNAIIGFDQLLVTPPTGPPPTVTERSSIRVRNCLDLGPRPPSEIPPQESVAVPTLAHFRVSRFRVRCPAGAAQGRQPARETRTCTTPPPGS
jgi:hypothetical protein